MSNVSGPPRRTAYGVALAMLAAVGISPAQAMNRADCQAAADYSAAHGGKVLIIQQNGREIFRFTATGVSLQDPRRIYSGTKLLWMLAAAAAEKEGVFGFDDHVSDFLPARSEDSRRARITVRQLLDFTGGLEPVWGLHGADYNDRNAVAGRARIVAAPGEAFIYGPAALQLFHAFFVHQLADRRDTPTKYLERKVLHPLGLGPQRYLEDHSGNPLLATGFLLTPREWLRVGTAVVRRQLSLPPLRGSAVNPAYSFGLWNNHLGARGREIDPEETLARPWQQQSWKNACLCRQAPPDLLASIGSGGQRLYMVASEALVVVRFGDGSAFRDAEFLRRLFSK